MPPHDSRKTYLDPRDPWVIDVRDISRRPGLSRTLSRAIQVDMPLGLPEVVCVASGTELAIEVLAESVVEGVLITGTVQATTIGQCARCLDPLSDVVEAEFAELFCYPDAAAELTADDEASYLTDDQANLEPTVRDAVVLALPVVPLCEPDCAGLCVECGMKWADLEPGHGHEKMDPRWTALVKHIDDAPADGREHT